MGCGDLSFGLRRWDFRFGGYKGVFLEVVGFGGFHWGGGGGGCGFLVFGL